MCRVRSPCRSMLSIQSIHILSMLSIHIRRRLLPVRRRETPPLCLTQREFRGVRATTKGRASRAGVIRQWRKAEACNSNSQILTDAGGDGGVALVPGLPHRPAPAFDGLPALILGSGHDISGSNAAALFGERKTWPFLSSGPAAMRLGELHVGALNLASSQSSFQVEIQPEERKVKTDRRRFSGGMLRPPSIQDVLMKELAVAQSQSP